MDNTRNLSPGTRISKTKNDEKQRRKSRNRGIGIHSPIIDGQKMSLDLPSKNFITRTKKRKASTFSSMISPPGT